jgi:hypothetical protein
VLRARKKEDSGQADGDLPAFGSRRRDAYESFYDSPDNDWLDGRGSTESEEGANPVARAATVARDAAENIASEARDAGEKVVSGVRNAGEKVASGAKDVTQGVARKARQQGQMVSQKFDESPMVVGAVALAVGLAVGFTVPVSDRERRIFGARRDELMEKARDVVDETRDKVKHVAEETAPEIRSTIADAARNEGLIR